MKEQSVPWSVPRETRLGFLAAAGTALFVLESFVSLPVPFLKIGLANVSTLLALASFGPADALTIVVIRVLTALLRRSIAYGRSSNGACDITVEPVVQTWNLLSERQHVPTPDGILKLLPLVDYRLIEFGDRTVFLPNGKMGIDLGAIGKGYAADRAALTRRVLSISPGR